MTTNQIDKFEKTFLIMLTIVSFLFAAIGFVMIIIDKKYSLGNRYLMTAIVYVIALFLIKNGENKPNYTSPMFCLGVVLSAIGLTNAFNADLHLGIWAFGIVCLVSVLLQSIFNKTG